MDELFEKIQKLIADISSRRRNLLLSRSIRTISILSHRLPPNISFSSSEVKS